MTWAPRTADAEAWRGAIEDLTAGRRTLVGLWGAPDVVRMALHGEGETFDDLHVN